MSFMLGFVKGAADQVNQNYEQAAKDRAERVKERMKSLQDLSAKQRERELQTSSALTQARILAKDLADGDGRAERIFYERLQSGEDVDSIRKSMKDVTFRFEDPADAAAQSADTRLSLDEQMTGTQLAGPAAAGPMAGPMPAPPAEPRTPGDTLANLLNPQPDLQQEDAEARRRVEEATGASLRLGDVPAPFAGEMPNYSLVPKPGSEADEGPDRSTEAKARAWYVTEMMSDDPARKAEAETWWEAYKGEIREKLPDGPTAARAFQESTEVYRKHLDNASGRINFANTAAKALEVAQRNPAVLTSVGSALTSLQGLFTEAQTAAEYATRFGVMGADGQTYITKDSLSRMMNDQSVLAGLSSDQKQFMLYQYEMAFALARAEGQTGVGLSDKDFAISMMRVVNSRSVDTFAQGLRNTIGTFASQEETEIAMVQRDPAIRALVKMDESYAGDFAPVRMKDELEPAAQALLQGGGAGPAPGTVEDGYEFQGGDPADPANWRKVE